MINKKENLCQRLNRGMKAIEVLPGVVVATKMNKSPNSGNTYNEFHILQNHTMGTFLVEIEEKFPQETYLLYLGIEEMGPFIYEKFGTLPRYPFLTVKNKIFVFKLFYDDHCVYLPFDKPHDYYNVFIRNLRRVGGIVNFGK